MVDVNGLYVCFIRKENKIKLYEKIIWVFVGVIFGLFILGSLIETRYYIASMLLLLFTLLLLLRFLKNNELKLILLIGFIVFWLMTIFYASQWPYFFIILPIVWITMRLFRIKFHFGLLFLILNPLTLFIGYNLGFLAVREVTCGPSEKVTSPLAKSIVEYVGNYGLPQDIEDIKDLPYILKCEKSVLSGDLNKEGKSLDETCYFYHDNKQYYMESSFYAYGLSLKTVSIRIGYVETKKYDKTEKYYHIEYSPRENKYNYYPKARTHYKDSSGRCGRWYPFGRIWGH